MTFRVQFKRLRCFRGLRLCPNPIVTSLVADSPESNLRVEVFYEGFENGALQITTQRTVQVVVHAVVVPASFELVTSFRPGS